jgi:signal transduction histidine kinase
VERPTVVIICDEPEFARAITNRWQTERNSPSFSVANSNFCGQLQAGHFDLAIAGGLQESPESVIEVLRRSGKPVLHVSRGNGLYPKLPGIVQLPEVPDWPELLLVVARQILDRERATADLVELTEANTRLEHQASLGRYMLEVRHSLNNALTSVLGNSELMLLDSQPLPPGMRLQLETVRNMGMRINEIMQRFSSLQKEMHLIEQQSGNKASKAAAGR